MVNKTNFEPINIDDFIHDPINQEKVQSYPPELVGRFNSFIVTAFDDSMTVEMQIRTMIKWVKENIDVTMSALDNMEAFKQDSMAFQNHVKDTLVTLINQFTDTFDDNLQFEMQEILKQWDNEGYLQSLINEYTNERVDHAIKIVNESEARLNDLENNKIDKDGNEQIDFTNFNERTKLMWLSKEDALPNIETDSISNSHLANNSVSSTKINGKLTTNNLFTTDKIKSGFYHGDLGNIITHSQSSNYFTLITPLDVTDGDVIHISHAIGNAYAIGTDNVGNVTQKPELLLNNVEYKKVTILPNTTRLYVSINVNYLDLVKVTKNEVIQEIKPIEWLEIKPDTINMTMINQKSQSINLFDFEKTENAHYGFNVDDNTILTKGSNPNWYSIVLDIKPYDVVRISHPYKQSYLITDVNNKIIQKSTQSADGTTPTSVLTPLNSNKIYLNIYKDFVNQYMVTINQPLPSTYVSGNSKKTLDWLEVKQNNLSKEIQNIFNIPNYSDEEFINFGTSISWQDGKPYSSTGLIARGWQTILKEKLGFKNYNNQAVSGSPLIKGSVNGEGTVERIVSFNNFNDYLYQFIEVGTNDFALNAELGTIQPPKSLFDDTTFIGALQLSIETIIKQTNDPKRLKIFTPLHRNNKNKNSWDTVNTAGNRLIDYANAIKEVASLYSIKVFDLLSESGISPLTLSIDTLDGLHPNDDGYLKFGAFVSNELLRD